MNQKRSFIDKLMGISRVDNAVNPDSAYSKSKQLKRKPVVTKQQDEMRRHLEQIYKKNTQFGRGWGP